MTQSKRTGETAYGRRLILNVIDDVAKETPDREWLSIPRTSRPEDGWQTITYVQLAKAVDRAAHDILDNLGPPQEKFPTIAYLSPNDSRYFIFAFAAVKAGYKALFISPRNSLEGQLNLFESTDCRAIAYASEFKDSVDLWLQKRDMKRIAIPPERDWYSNEEVTPIPYEKEFEEAQWDPLVVLHSSGSTGLPKPIVSKQGVLAVADAFHNCPERNGAHLWVPEIARKSRRFFNPMPVFHAAGMLFGVCNTLLGLPTALAIPSRPLTADLAYECLKYSNVDAAMFPPSILEDMRHVPDHVDALSKLTITAFGGGNLSSEAGDFLVENGVQLMNGISATETGALPLYLQPNTALWRYFIFDSELGGFDWRRVPDEDNAYRLIIKRKAQHPGLQGIFYTFPELEEYDTNDIYTPHPSLKDHWKYIRRSDTVIVFSNGEKLNPVTIEDTVTSHPRVKGAVVVGQGRFQPLLILEPANDLRDDRQAQDLLQDVWPLITQANEETVSHGRIERDFVMFTTPGKPFPRADKGTIQRNRAVKMYQDEIDRFYEKAEGVHGPDAPVLDVSSEATLMESIQQVFSERLGAPLLGPDVDLFTAGIDSLQVINATRLLSAGMKAAGVTMQDSALAPRNVYANPTFRALATYLYGLVQSDRLDGDAEENQDIRIMKAQIKKYTSDLPTPNTTKPPPLDESQTVLVTGTTGTLGSHLLHCLINNSNVKAIFCLNRSEHGRARQVQLCTERGLSTDFTKCEFLQADLSLPDLGLGKEKYNDVLRRLDRIIHNGWPVNFNMSIASFEPHVRGVRHLVDLNAKANKQVPILFVSSIGSVEKWAKPEPVPEIPITDLTVASMGYGCSKLVSSLILDEVSKVSGIPAASIRVGQIAGPRQDKGVWNRHEWLPSIIASSLYLGALPDSLGLMNTVDWVPIEDVAHIILEVAGVKSAIPVQKISGYFHCVNPQKTSWSKLALIIKEFYGDRIVKLVSFREWLEALRESQKSTVDPNKNPGIKLLDMYEGVMQGAEAGAAQTSFSMERTKKRSETARGLEAITPELMQHWCRQWDFDTWKN